MNVYRGVTVEYDKDIDSCHERVFENYFRPNLDTMFLGGNDLVYKLEQEWPGGHFHTENGSSPFGFWGVFVAALKEVWGDAFEDSDSNEIVGEVDGNNVEREVTVFRRNRPA